MVLGNAKLAAANQAAPAERAVALRPVRIERAGLSARAVAAELNSRDGGALPLSGGSAAADALGALLHPLRTCLVR